MKLAIFGATGGTGQQIVDPSISSHRVARADVADFVLKQYM